MLLTWISVAVFITQSLVNASLFDDILAAIQNATNCASCLDLLVPMQALAFLGDDAFTETFTELCDVLKLEDPDVCQGEIAAQGPILAHDLRSISTIGSTAVLLCDGLFGLCDPLPTIPHTVTFPSPVPSNPTTFTSSGRTPFQVVHISDVHIDRNYTVGAEANCTKNICCMDFADEQGPVTEPAGPFGNSRCDTPTSLANSMLSAIKQFGSNASFTIFTGDVVEGATWLETQSLVTNDLEEFDQQMLTFTGMDGIFYGSVGNHDNAPVNSFARSSTHTANNSQWVFDILSADWQRWIGADSASTLLHQSGSYSVVHPGTNLRLIAINTMYWYNANFWLYDSDDFQPDPNGILAFIVQELQAAEDAGQRAWIFGHIPLGSSNTFRDQSNYYDQIVQRYKNTIAAQFFGHTHKDEFEIAYSDYLNQTAENAVSFGLIAPAVTPTSGNPAFKIYDIDPDTYEVMDAKVFITNISDPNFQSMPQWELYYSARESYGPLVGKLTPVDSLNASFWHLLSEAFVTNDTAFQLYNTRISRGGDVVACTGDCKDIKICDIRAMRSENNCDVPTPGVQFRKRQQATAEIGIKEPACEGHSIGSIFRGMMMASQES